MLIIAGHVFVAPSDVNAFVCDARRTLSLGRSADGNLFFSFTLDDPSEGSITGLGTLARPTITGRIFGPAGGFSHFRPMGRQDAQ